MTYHFLDHGVVVTIGHVLAVPVDQSTSPIDSTIAVTGKTGRPQTELDFGWSLRVMILTSGRVVSLVAVHGTKNSAIHGPCEIVRLPINCVGVDSRLGVCGRDVQLIPIFETSAAASKS